MIRVSKSMKIVMLITILSFNLFSCPEGEIYNPSPKQDPNFEILAQLRDSGVDVGQSLNELSVGGTNLSDMAMVNWRADYSSSEQLRIFGQYLGRSIFKKQEGFEASSMSNPHLRSLKHFDDQIQAYHKSLYTNRAINGVSIGAVFEDIQLGEVIYFVKDMTNIDNFITIKFYNESSIPIDDLNIRVHDVTSSSSLMAGPGEGEVDIIIIEQVKPAFWNDMAFQLWKLQINAVE